MAAIELRGVTKRYGDVTAVRDLDLTVEEGEVFGFLGPNGAGKSTTINVLLDFVRPTEGRAEVLSLDAQADSVAVRERTGVLPEGYDVYDRLTGRRHVEFAMRSKDVDGDPDALLDRVGIADAADRKAGGYSKGMQQRLVLGMALVGDPDLLILDEPSSGLDPTGAKEMRDIVRAEADRGATVFFSSHVLGQVEAVCDRVGIMREGQLVAEDSIEGLRDAAGGEETLVVTVDAADESTVDAVRALDGVSTAASDGGTVTVTCASDAKTRVIATLEEGGVEVKDFTTEEASLEDLFLHYTGDRDADPADRADADDRDEGVSA
ncbi:ABC transporter ATP-binding protein [Candidatus Halobonum tyrrellensis]|uniref:Sulfate-transporting ATPase n=1 Tax=Candidatus Halobonum tyrrellensis G22 TaxID=1324957 RepID=V4J2F2_9EURY|nr:ABC transporter ATP-binding protein [Candidatus Halobonum tyrrellensis]ESP89587.1 sulfate-transporting ATPase [Candidatus Halobonum tyrrellensis G22]